MKKLLLAFALIGFITTSSYASATIVETNSEIEFCDDHKNCDKKDCKHDKKATASAKKEYKKGGKKSCCASKATASKGKSCHGSKTADNKTASITKPVKKVTKNKK